MIRYFNFWTGEQEFRNKAALVLSKILKPAHQSSYIFHFQTGPRMQLKFLYNIDDTSGDKLRNTFGKDLNYIRETSMFQI